MRSVEYLMMEAEKMDDGEVERYSGALQQRKEGEEYLGRISEKAKRLFAYAHKMQREIALQQAERMFMEEDIEFSYRMNALNAAVQVMEKIFWYTVRSEMMLHSEEAENIGIRKGWEIYRVIKGPEDKKREMLQQMMGGTGLQIHLGQQFIQPDEEEEE